MRRIGSDVLRGAGGHHLRLMALTKEARRPDESSTSSSPWNVVIIQKGGTNKSLMTVVDTNRVSLAIRGRRAELFFFSGAPALMDKNRFSWDDPFLLCLTSTSRFLQRESSCVIFFFEESNVEEFWDRIRHSREFSP